MIDLSKGIKGRNVAMVRYKVIVGGLVSMENDTRAPRMTRLRATDVELLREETSDGDRQSDNVKQGRDEKEDQIYSDLRRQSVYKVVVVVVVAARSVQRLQLFVQASEDFWRRSVLWLRATLRTTRAKRGGTILDAGRLGYNSRVREAGHCTLRECYQQDNQEREARA